MLQEIGRYRKRKDLRLDISIFESERSSDDCLFPASSLNSLSYLLHRWLLGHPALHLERLHFSAIPFCISRSISYSGYTVEKRKPLRQEALVSIHGSDCLIEESGALGRYHFSLGVGI